MLIAMFMNTLLSWPLCYNSHFAFPLACTYFSLVRVLNASQDAYYHVHTHFTITTFVCLMITTYYMMGNTFNKQEYHTKVVQHMKRDRLHDRAQPRIRALDFPITFSSHQLNTREQNYSTIEHEALAMIYEIKKVHRYLLACHFLFLRRSLNVIIIHDR